MGLLKALARIAKEALEHEDLCLGYIYESLGAILNLPSVCLGKICGQVRFVRPGHEDELLVRSPDLW